MSNEEHKIMKKKCPYCNKEFSSLSKKQLEYNYYAHLGACPNKGAKDEIKVI